MGEYSAADMSEPTLMIYGASGYTGNLVAARAVASGLRPILAGRDSRKISLMAGKFGVEKRVFSLHDPGQLEKAFDDIAVVLNCAGPFVYTAGPVVDACLTTGTHYIDITGEMDVFEALAARDQDAKEAHIMILPGAGIDVVPSDCLVADLAAHHPGGEHLRLAIATRSGVSRGTMRTIVMSIDNFRIRREGRITRVAGGSLRHEFDFGEPPRSALVSSLGDVSTAYWSTSIPNIESYNQTSNLFRIITLISRLYGWLPAKPIWLALLNALVDRAPEGPSESRRRSNYAIFVAEIEDPSGNRATARLRTPDPYDLTAEAAVSIAARTLNEDFKIGYQTPSSAYGADLVREFDGVRWEYLGG